MPHMRRMLNIRIIPSMALSTHLADEKHFYLSPQKSFFFSFFDVNKIWNSHTIHRFPPSKIIFYVLCNKIGESNKLGRHSLRFIVSLAAISLSLLQNKKNVKASLDMKESKNHKTQFTMVKRKCLRREVTLEKYEIYGFHIPQQKPSSKRHNNAGDGISFKISHITHFIMSPKIELFLRL